MPGPVTTRGQADHARGKAMPVQVLQKQVDLPLGPPYIKAADNIQNVNR
jgi:hypothetical protein